MYDSHALLYNNRFRPSVPLRFVASEDRYSVYVDRDGETYNLAHGTGHRMTDDIDDLNIQELWRQWCFSRNRYAQDAFIKAVEALLTDVDQVNEQWAFCTACYDFEPADEMTWANDDERVCDYCLRHKFWHCNECEEYFSDTTTTYEGREVCEGCRDDNYHFCDEGEHYVHDDSACECVPEEEYGCLCESPAQQFQVRHEDGLLGNDDRVQVSLPAGEISETGMGEIANVLRNVYYHGLDFQGWDADDLTSKTAYWNMSFHLAYEDSEIGSTWQTKKGNFTKRLSRWAYQKHGVKLPASLISQIGNIARAHSQGVDHWVEITRDLNQSPDVFVHEDSCWWGSYYKSRCTLKSNGGFGLLTFEGEDRSWAAGRAWVMPVNFDAQSETFAPTFDAVSADAFLVFNGYGDLENYAPARILAHMAGMTYRKNQAMGHRGGYDAMYVNSGSGYLVAPEEIASVFNDTSKRIYITGEQHSNLFENEQATLKAQEAHLA